MAKDPYRYFRIEARELLDGLTRAVLDIEKGDYTPDIVARMLRQAHTLKGAARVVKQPAIAELAHGLEDILAEFRATAELPSPLQVSTLLQLCDRVSVQLQGLDPGSAAEPPRQPTAPVEEARPRAAQTPTGDSTLDSVRVDLMDMELLLREVAAATVQVGALRKDLAATARLRGLARELSAQLASGTTKGDAGLLRAGARAEALLTEIERFARDFGTNVERIGEDIAQVEERTQRLRLIPASTVFPTLERAVRDAGEMLGLSVEFTATGGEVRLEAGVLAALRDALMHSVSNAVAHGIEPAAARATAGKATRGRVELKVERRGSRVAFVCVDDGGGIDLDAVRTAAEARGLLGNASTAPLDADQLRSLLGTGGFTTSREVTELSGRGIGLDVVRATSERLHGEWNLQSERGRGTTIEILVPVSISSLQSLLVDAAGSVLAIPLDAIRSTLRFKDAEIARSPHRDSICVDREMVAFLPLAEALRQPLPKLTKARTWSAVVVEAGGRRIALGVDRLLGTANVVMRALPDVVRADATIAGASLDADGNPQLVLDPRGLVAAVLSRHGRERAPERSPPAPILVVDDSLTTRMLEQNILESAGFAVELAVSAEEALGKAQARAYSLFVVDVEMPGMDGFAFVAKTREDPRLRDVPAILVTSRNAPEDKRRGAEAGASAYIVKGEFDQAILLKTIRRLIGSP